MVKAKEIFSKIDAFTIHHYLWFLLILVALVTITTIYLGKEAGVAVAFIGMICAIVQNASIQAKIKLRDEELRSRLKHAVVFALEGITNNVIDDLDRCSKWEKGEFKGGECFTLNKSYIKEVNYYNCDIFKDTTVQVLIMVNNWIEMYNQEMKSLAQIRSQNPQTVINSDLKKPYRRHLSRMVTLLAHLVLICEDEDLPYLSKIKEKYEKLPNVSWDEQVKGFQLTSTIPDA